MTQRVKTTYPVPAADAVRIVVAAARTDARRELSALLATSRFSAATPATLPEAAGLLAAEARPTLLLVADLIPGADSPLPLLEEARLRCPRARRLLVADPPAVAELAGAINSGLVQRLLLRPLTAALLEAALEEQAERATLLAEASALTELTAKQSRELDLAQRLMRLQRLAAVGQLAAGLAHEINNPLGTILAFSQILIREGRFGGEDLEALKFIEQGAVRCKRVIDAVVRFAHLTGGSPVREEVELVEVAREGWQLMEDQLADSRITITFEPPPNPVRTKGTYQHLLQTTQALLANAVEALRDSPRRRHIALRVYERRDRACLSVEDTGRGIPAGQIDRIFEPFFTTKDEGEAAGLGLTTADRIAQDHGGLIEVKSRVDEGSTFTLVLPLLAEAVVEVNAA